jgi:hypothetical protein
MPMAMGGFGRVYVAVLSSEAPTDAEWERWIELLRERAGRDRRVLVETRGGPTPRQRRELADALKEEDVRFAVLTSSIAVRGIITALSWLGVPHGAFAPQEHRQAAEFLELTDAELARVEAELPRLREESQPRSTGRRP